MPHTLFDNIAAVGATSTDVWAHQVPQALIPFALGGFAPQAVTLTVGGNDLLAVVRYAVAHPGDPAVAAVAQAALNQYAQNLAAILGQLSAGLPGVTIFVSNQYTIPELAALLPAIDQLVSAFNATTAQIVGAFPAAHLVDVYSAFLGRRNLVQLERPGATLVEVHPTAVGQRVIAQAFQAVIESVK